jgi:hypothetical protein
MRKLLLFPFLFSIALAGEGATRVNQVLVRLKGPKQIAQETFVLTEKEINDFAEAAIKEKKRLGVKKMEFDLKEEGNFQTRTVINMDDVQLIGLTFQMFNALLSGTQTLETVGKFSTSSGKGAYTLQSAQVNGITVPAVVANAVISFLGKVQSPYVDVTEPFDLPYQITDITIASDQVVITR